MEKPRREFLNAGAALGAATVAACAAPMQAGAKGDNALFTHPATTIPVVGSDQQFAVRRIYCVGRNYAAHAREMGSDPTREPPFFFQKPTDAIQVAGPGVTIDHPYPPVTKNYHYEVELVAALKSGGLNIRADKALENVYGYAVGLDMTRRDLQRAMGDQKKPWEVGKSFDHSAVVSHIHPADRTGHLAKGAIWLKVNGNVKQNANLDMMTWNVAEMISHLSTYYELMAGDIIYCGTPENVGPVVAGDVMTGHIDGIYEINVKVV
ncbi:MAG: fumarylacetoacetate hydrolase family protein [Usitatibacter sp.]